MEKQRIRVGILFGGKSAEHEISLLSAKNVIDAIDKTRYQPVLIGIDKSGRWVTNEPSRFLLNSTDPKLIALNKAESTGVALVPRSAGRLTDLDTAGLDQSVDVVFPILHGPLGEDGTIQGLLKLAEVPFVGAGVLGSAVGMDKDVMKRLLRDAGLPVAPWILVLRREWETKSSRVRRCIGKEIGYPAFVKPANLGSSVGISKVHRAGELDLAMNRAAKYDRKILVEKGIDAREIECAVLGNDQPEASAPGEIIPANEFYDYDAKYISEGSRLIIPARLSARQTREARELAIRAFKAIDCSGMARVDFLLDRKTGKLFVNEINTIPGFTSISMYPKLWEASGLPYPKLIDRLIELALQRHREKLKTQYRL